MKVAVVGAGNGGCAVAGDMAYRGLDVTLIKTSNSIHDDNFNYLEKNNGKNTKDAYVTWATILPENVINPLEKKVKDKFVKQNLKVDAVILAMGAKPNNALFYEAQKTNLAKEE